MQEFDHKRITLFAGHYGSGKTNIAVNYAFLLRSKGYPVTIADLDIVNPYYRTKDSEAELKEAGINLITSKYANSNVEVPSLPQELYSIVDDRSFYAVLDVGGDDRGALALGRYTPKILEENNYEMIFVVNKYRPLTSNPQGAIKVMREIESAGGIKITSIANNSNLGSQTSFQDVLDSIDYAEQIGRMSGLKIKFTSVEEKLYDLLADKIENLFPLKLQNKRNWN